MRLMGVIGDAGGHIVELGCGLDVIELGGLHKRIHGGSTRPGAPSKCW